MGGRSARALALEFRLANAARFFPNGPRRWSPGFSRPSLINTPRFFRNGIISLLGPPAGAWAAGGRVLSRSNPVWPTPIDSSAKARETGSFLASLGSRLQAASLLGHRLKPGLQLGFPPPRTAKGITVRRTLSPRRLLKKSLWHTTAWGCLPINPQQVVGPSDFFSSLPRGRGQGEGCENPSVIPFSVPSSSFPP